MYAEDLETNFGSYVIHLKKVEEINSYFVVTFIT